MQNILYVKEIVESQKFTILNKSTNYNSLIVKSPNINRMGLELSGFTTYKECWEVIYWGTKEHRYLNSLNENQRIKIVKNILSMSPPLIILGKKFKNMEFITDLAIKHNVTVVISNKTQTEFQIDLLNFMLDNSAPYEMVHGSLCNIFGVGTLIIGDSGVGKSETVIELIKRGHIFVADDTVKVTKHGSRLFGTPTVVNKDIIEIRGLGILSFSRTFGIEKMISSSKINVIIELNRLHDKKITFERVGIKDKYYNILGVDLIYYQIPVTEGRNVSEVIETAITKYKLKRDGFDASQIFLDNIKKKRNSK